MTGTMSRADVARFAEGIATALGLARASVDRDDLGDVLAERIRASGSAGLESYLARVASREVEEIRALAERLTVGETYFFRHPDQFRALAEIALPERLQARQAERRLSLLSAGCASGEEAYSLALQLSEALPEVDTWDIRITAVDVNPAALRKARQARYGEWSLRSTSPDLLRRNFSRQDRHYVLQGPERNWVRFEERNLLAEDPAFWRPGRFDIVLCRNVLMYFTPEAMRSVVARFAGALAPGGWLFLGPAETLRGLSREFQLAHSHDAFYYRLRESPAPAAGWAAQRGLGLPVVALPAGAAQSDDRWVDAIRLSSERISELAEISANTASRPPSASADLALVMALIGRERFGDALDLLSRTPGAADNADAKLILAALLTNLGRTAEAEEACREILAGDDCHASAHYLLALCREAAGDLPGAVAADEAASYLDPAFAMPHLHLGLLARRAGDPVTARRELDRALGLLATEDAGRLLLLGGGFSREALRDLCLAEPASSGARP